MGMYSAPRIYQRGIVLSYLGLDALMTLNAPLPAVSTEKYSASPRLCANIRSSTLKQTGTTKSGNTHLWIFHCGRSSLNAGSESVRTFPGCPPPLNLDQATVSRMYTTGVSDQRSRRREDDSLSVRVRNIHEVRFLSLSLGQLSRK